MRLVIVLGLTLVTVATIGAVTSASAHEFEYTNLPALLLSRSEGPQVLTTLAGTLTCNTLKGHGIQDTFAFKSLKLTASYTGCIVAGISHTTGKADEPINVEYEYGAEGTVVVLKQTTVLTSIAGLKCTITVLSQGPRSSVTYKNVSGELLFGENILGLETSATGAGCLEKYTSSKTGVYVGSSIVKAEGGEIGWI